MNIFCFCLLDLHCRNGLLYNSCWFEIAGGKELTNQVFPFLVYRASV